jgi:hypothetical protein
MAATDSTKTFRGFALWMIALAAVRSFQHWRLPDGTISVSRIAGAVVLMALVYALAYIADVFQLGTGLRRFRRNSADKAASAAAAPTSSDRPSTQAAPSARASDWSQIRERLFGGDFGRVIPSQAEAHALAIHQPPIAETDVQRFLVWRRSCLFVAVVCLSARVLDTLFTKASAWFSADGFGGFWNAGVISLFIFLEVFVEAFACVLLWIACLQWASIGTSRSAARVSWLLFTLFPIVLLVLPRGYLLSFESGAERAVLNGILLVGAVTILIPWAMSFFPGIIRACLTLKSLMPEAAGPGWMLMCVAPLYAVVFVAAGLALLQMELTQTIAAGVLLIATSSLVYIVYGTKLVRPLGREEAAVVIQRAKKASLVLLGAGLTLILWNLRGLVDDMSPLKVLLVCARLWGAILLLNVVAVDLALVLQSAAYEHSKRFQESPLRRVLDARLAAFAAVNLTAVGDGEVQALKQVRSRVGEAIEQQRKNIAHRAQKAEVRQKNDPKA